MKAFVITLIDDPYSVQCAQRCIKTAEKVGIAVQVFPAVSKLQAESVMQEHQLAWSWADNNTRSLICEKTKLQHFPYTTSDLRAKIGCAMSHFLLWKRCVELDEPILVLEHDAVFLKALPEIQFNGICQINDPEGATRKGGWWSKQMMKRQKEGVFEKTWVTTPDERSIPDGLAGNSAYLIKPWAAKLLIDKCYEVGLWPNDALMCKQLFPFLEEYYPFITKVEQTRSTTME